MSIELPQEDLQRARGRRARAQPRLAGLRGLRRPPGRVPTIQELRVDESTRQTPFSKELRVEQVKINGLVATLPPGRRRHVRLPGEQRPHLRGTIRKN